MGCSSASPLLAVLALAGLTCAFVPQHHSIKHHVSQYSESSAQALHATIPDEDVAFLDFDAEGFEDDDGDYDDFDEGGVMYEDEGDIDLVSGRGLVEIDSMSFDDDDEDDSAASDAPVQPIRRQRREKKVPILAIVGRPNVGKSALVNRIAGTQSGGAIVADEEGITRDRTYRNAEFLGEEFQLVDTGGLVFDDNDALFASEIRQQAMVAIEEAAAVILVVDGQVGPTIMDEQLASFLRKEITKQIPVILAVNKCESEKTGGVAAAEFWGLGLGEPHPVSALHGVGTADLLEDVFENIVEKGSAIKGFGTKVKELEAAKEAIMNQSDEPLEGEDETDVLLRQYGLGRDEEDVIERYENALAAFDDKEKQVRFLVGNRRGFNSIYCYDTTVPSILYTHSPILFRNVQSIGGNQHCNRWQTQRRQEFSAQQYLWWSSCHCK